MEDASCLGRAEVWLHRHEFSQYASSPETPKCFPSFVEDITFFAEIQRCIGRVGREHVLLDKDIVYAPLLAPKSRLVQG